MNERDIVTHTYLEKKKWNNFPWEFYTSNFYHHKLYLIYIIYFRCSYFKWIYNDN